MTNVPGEIVKAIECFTVWIFTPSCFAFIAETSSSKRVKHFSMTKAIGALVSVVTVSILCMAAISILLGGFYKGRKKVNLDEENDEDGHAMRRVSTTPTSCCNRD